MGQLILCYRPALVQGLARMGCLYCRLAGRRVLLMVMELTRVPLMFGAALYPLQTSPVLGVSACRLAPLSDFRQTVDLYKPFSFFLRPQGQAMDVR